MESNYDFNNNIDSVNDGNAINVVTSDVITKSFFWMFLGLLGSALVAWYTYASELWLKLFLNNTFIWLAIGELVVVIAFSLLFRKLSPSVVAALYFIYSMLNGVTLSTIFVVYDMASITYAFGATAVLFGALALYGAKTNADLTKLGNICLVGLLVGLVFTLVNVFVGNEMLDIILTWAMLIIFCGITAYDINKLKKAQGLQTEGAEKLHIYFAMELYLDFINIFLRLLRLIANSRNN